MASRAIHKQCYSFDTNLDDIQKCVEDHHRVLIVLRGVTGSGKSTMAEQLTKCTDNFKVFTAEDAPQITKLVRASLKDEDTHLVIVDDDNVDRIRVKNLLEIGIAEQYECFVLEPQTEWKLDSTECLKRSFRKPALEVIESQINDLLEGPITWDYILKGSDKSLELQSFHTSDLETTPSSSSPTSPKPGSPFSAIQPLFSMKPVSQKKEMRTVATNVTVENISRVMADLPDDGPNCCVPEIPESVDRPYRGKISMLDRAGQFPSKGYAVTLFRGNSEVIEFSMIRSVFWQADMLTIRHQLQTRGYESTYQILQLLGENKALGIIPGDDSMILDELKREESQTYLSIRDELNSTEQQRAEVNFIEGAYFVDTSSDEQIALLLEAEINGRDTQREIDKENLERLQRIFPTCNKEEVRFIFEDIADKNYAIALDHLGFAGYEQCPDLQETSPKTWSNIASSSRGGELPKEFQKSDHEKGNHFLNLTHTNMKSDDGLRAAQKFAIEERIKAAEERRSNRGRSSAGRYRDTISSEQLRGFNEKLTTMISKIDQRLRVAHRSPFFIDLHYMSVIGAIALVKEAIEAAKYYKRLMILEQRICPITVITGSGNNSRDGARIKPELEKVMGQMGMRINKVNDGCIQVKI